MRLNAGALKQLRFTGTLLLLALVSIAGLLYWQSVEQQRQYLTSRDFRLLTVLATQLQGLFDSNARIFQNAVDDIYSTDLAKRHFPSIDAWRKAAMDEVPILRVADYPVDTPPTEKLLLLPPRLALDIDGTQVRLRMELSGRRENESNGASRAVLTVRAPLATLLGPTFASKLQQGVFDTLALATPDGHVVFATGARQQELQSTALDALMPITLADPKKFPQLARTISVQDAVVASVPYKVFLQPCCATVALPSSASGGGGGLVIAGLIEADALYGAALAISPTLVIAGILATLLGFVIWPFLRLSFIGERQRVTVWDVVQLAACSMLGLAVAAIVIITSDLYTRLDADIDEQLEALAKNLSTHLHREIGDAYQQMSKLEKNVDRLMGDPKLDLMIGCLPLDQDAPSPSTKSTAKCEDRPGVPAAKSNAYQAFALIDANGRQQVKSTPIAFVPSRLNVRERAYVETVQKGRSWRNLAECPSNAEPPGCFLESVWSWTDGQPQAVLSKPIFRHSNESYTARQSNESQAGDSVSPLQVAALAFTLKAVSQPVVPPGFEFAIIDSRGKVLFHSDRQRNTQEDLFLETDQDRRLRAIVAGHSAGSLDISYWGKPFRAHVEPARISDWSIVTLSDKGAVRGLVLEWTAVSLLMLSVYLVAWVACVVLALRIGASWVWPDLQRRGQYLLLAGIYAGFLVLFAIVASTGDTLLLLRTAVAIAVAAWALAFVVLRRRPANAIRSHLSRGQDRHAGTVDDATPAVQAGHAGRAHLSQLRAALQDLRRRRTVGREYALAGALFLTLCGTVPGVGFVVRSYDMHIESYVKHRQLGLARALQAKDERAASPTCDRTDEPQSGSMLRPAHEEDLDRNCWFFYQTIVREPKAGQSNPSERQEAHHELLQELLEEYLPYYAESSVFMRELLHDHAADDSWQSVRSRNEQLRLETTLDTPHVVVSSVLPAAVPRWPWQTSAGQVPGADHHQPMLVMPYLAPLFMIGLVGVAYRMVRFALRHVYLMGVSEPMWAADGMVEAAGANVMIRYEEPADLEGRLRDTSRLKLDPIARADDSSSEWRHRLMEISRKDIGHAVVVDDLDSSLNDVDLTRAKLEMLEDLVNDSARTVAVLLKVPPATFQDSLRRGRDATLLELWSRLYKAFVVVDWRGGATGDRGTAGSGSPPKDWRRFFNWQAWRPDPAHDELRLLEILEQEGRHDRFIRSICDDIARSDALHSGALTVDQILDEIDDRASAHYRQLWASCSDDEKVVLGHVALHGLTTAASRRTVRRLLARRLLTKDPELRLMNRTLRRFIVSPDVQRQLNELEGSAEPSTWDRLRVPFALAVMTAGVFLFTTQRDMFNQTVAAVTALAGLVPTVLRTVSVIAQRESASAPPHA